MFKEGGTHGGGVHKEKHSRIDPSENLGPTAAGS